MSFEIPTEIEDYLLELDKFIEDKIKPLEQANDNIRFFDQLTGRRHSPRR